MGLIGKLYGPDNQAHTFLIYEGSEENLEDKLRIIQSHFSRPDEQQWKFYLPDGTVKVREEEQKARMQPARRIHPEITTPPILVQGRFYKAIYDTTGEETPMMRYVINPMYHHPN